MDYGGRKGAILQLKQQIVEQRLKAGNPGIFHGKYKLFHMHIEVSS